MQQGCKWQAHHHHIASCRLLIPALKTPTHQGGIMSSNLWQWHEQVSVA